jgi:hypothetical protein
MHHADAAATFAQQVEALALARCCWQVVQLLYCCCIAACLALLVVPEVEQKALKGAVQGFGVRVPAVRNFILISVFRQRMLK